MEWNREHASVYKYNISSVVLINFICILNGKKQNDC